MSERFDAWFETELHRQLPPATPLDTRPETSRYHQFALRRWPARLARTVLAGTAVKVVAATAIAAAASGTAVTGSPNPIEWGQQVNQAVRQCKADLATGVHGIGGCVSAFATKHGQGKLNEHGKTQHGRGRGQGNGRGNTNDRNDNGNGNGCSLQGAPGAPGHGHGHAYGRDDQNACTGPSP